MVLNEMLEKKISIIIPTKDHPYYIKNILREYVKQDLKSKIIILDSSENEETRKIYEGYNSKLENLAYVHVDDITSDEKIIVALHLCETKYLWICGDGLIIDKNLLTNGIIDESCQVIHLIDVTARDNRIYCRKNHLSTNMVCVDPILFAKHFFWTGTFMGAIIIDNEIRDELVNTGVLNKYINTGFMLISAVLDLLVSEKIKTQILITKYYYPNPAKNEATWMNSESVFKIWAQEMPKAVNLLPNYYNSIKELLIKTTAVRNNYLSRRGLVRWRAKGIFNSVIEKKYEEDLLKTTQLSRRELKLFSKIPEFICKFVIFPFLIRNKIKRTIKMKGV